MTLANTLDPLLGAVILHSYRVLECVSDEPRGKNYRAEVVATGAPVLVKSMSPPQRVRTSRSTWMEAWGDAETLRRLDHPHVERVLECGLARSGEHDLFCVVTEMPDGETLHARLRRVQRMSVAESLTCARQIAEALSAAHRLGITHGDLRPTNVVLCPLPPGGTETVSVTVEDFGLLGLMQRAARRAPTLREMTGTPEYMAPEQIQGEAVTPATDLYALGVILYRMLCGRGPFQADNTMQLLRAHLTRTVPAMSERAPGVAVPAAVENLVRKCLAKMPVDRPTDAAELASALADCAAAIPRTATASRFAPAPPKAVTVAPVVEPYDDEAQTTVRTPAVMPTRPPPPVHSTREAWTRGAIVATVACLAAVTLHIQTRERLPDGDIAPVRVLARTRGPVRHEEAVRFELRSQTHGASATLRGRTYPVPFQIEVSPGTEPEMIEVSAPGATPRRLWLPLDHPMSLQVDLEMIQTDAGVATAVDVQPAPVAAESVARAHARGAHPAVTRNARDAGSAAADDEKDEPVPMFLPGGR